MRNLDHSSNCYGRTCVPGVIVIALLILSSHASAAEPGNGPFAVSAKDRAFLKQYCVTCHNEKLKTGGLTLDRIDLDDVSQSGEILEKVVRKVWSGSMPPAKAPRAEKPVVKAFLASLETSLDLEAAAHPNPGRPGMLHRLNRTEYLNSIRDLLGVELNSDEASLLPQDDTSYGGFDNNGDVLGLSPMLLERYLSMARRATTATLGLSAHAEPEVHTHYVDFGLSQNHWMEGLPLGTRGGTAFPYRFPANGEYTIRIRLQRDRVADRVIGLDRQGEENPQRQRIEVAVDGKAAALFSVGLDQTIHETLPASVEEFLKQPEPAAKKLSKVELAERNFKADQGLEFRLTVKAGPQEVRATFLPRIAPASSLVRDPYPAGLGGPPRMMGIDNVTITGPFKPAGPGETPSRSRLFSCRPDQPGSEMPCVRTILSTLGRRTYRRPVTESEMQELLTAYERGRRDGDFEAGFMLALRRMLMDPAFLFRVERDPAGIAPNTPYRISDLELASRLSFFLWSSVPDEPLLAAAEQGQLRDPAVLEAQVRRMLADQRAHNLVTNFASAWLSLRLLPGVLPDPVIFSGFDGSLRQSFQRETDLLLENVLLGDRSVLELLNANYTFVNERLARHYGIPGVYGSQFRRVSVTDGIRGGLLGQGSILTVTSYPNRTSPVLRGKWILDTLLGSPPAPPPPDVPALPEAEATGKILSVRERLSEHRKNPACAGCHARMDPLGFALENFDATGKWRVGESTGPADLLLHPIDASGQLEDGTKFQGIAGLKQMLQEHSDEFVYTMTERLLTFSLGRGVDWYDAPSIRAAVRAAQKDDYRFSTLLMSIVESPPFQMRMSQGSEHAVEHVKAELKH